MIMTLWKDRKFEPITDDGQLPTIIERLDGTEYRLMGKSASEEDYDFNKKTGDKWSVKEEIGHLLQSDRMWIGRLKDILTEKEYLRVCDATAEAVKKANFNSRDTEDIVDDFGETREELLSLFRELKAEDLQKKAKHPTSQNAMRVIDLAYMIAEHDDHHLAKISQILK